MAENYPQSTLDKVQAWFNKANQVNVPRTPYTAAVVDGTYRNPIDTYIDQASADARASTTSLPPMPPGFSDIASGVREGWNQLENSGSDRVSPQQAMQQTIVAGEPAQSMSPEIAMELLKSAPIAQQPDQAGSASTAPDLNRIAAQKEAAIPAAIQYKGNRRLLEDALQLYPNSGAAILTAAGKESDRNKEIAALSAQGYRPLELPGSSPNALPTGVMKQQGQGVKGSSLPDLQAQYEKQGISFDPNAMYEQMNYAIPGAKGTASGWRKVDPNRPQGSLSVVPALSKSDQERYNEIVANETRQREYAQGRGPQWDATQAEQAKQAVAFLKQMRDQEKDQRDYGLQKETLAETKSKNRMDAEARAAQIDRSIAADRNKAMRVDPRWIPTVASIIETEQKNALDPNKFTSNQHLSNGLSKYGIKTATDMQNPPDGLFISPNDPTQVFMRNPKTKEVAHLGSIDDYLKRWAIEHFAGSGSQPEDTVAPDQP